MMTKSGYVLQEQSSDFNQEAHSSNLVHLTKERPKSFNRKNSRKGAKSTANETQKTDIESEDLPISQVSAKPNEKQKPVIPDSPNKKSPPPLSPKPKQKTDDIETEKGRDTEKEVVPSRSINKKNTFKLPGLDELRGKKLRKTKKEDDVKEAKKDDSSIQLITYKKDTTNETDENIQGIAEEKSNKVSMSSFKTNSFGGSKRANSVSVKSSVKENESNRTLQRSFSTGRDVKSLREKLESGGNTLRNGISRIGNSVTARTSFRESKKAPKEETKQLISEDPDENTDQLVKVKKEEQEQQQKEQSEKEKQTKPPKEKLRLTSSQSVKITSSKRQPTTPTYKRLNSSPGSSRRFEDDSKTIENQNATTNKFSTTTEAQTGTYKKLQQSPKMTGKKVDGQTSFEEIVLDFEDFLEKQRINNSSTEKSDKQDQEELRNISFKSSETEIGKCKEVQAITDDIRPANNFDEHQRTNEKESINQEIRADGLLKENIDNSTCLMKPQTSDVDHLIKTSNEDQQSTSTIISNQMTKFSSSRSYENKREDKSSLTRSFTWNSYKTVSETDKGQKNLGIVQNNHVKEDSVYSSPVVRKSYSIKTYTPKPVRRKIDELGRILDKKGSAQRNILSSLSFLGKGKSTRRSITTEDKPITNKSEQATELTKEDMETTELYESNFKKSNARKASQDSWLGKSGLLESDSSKQKAPLIEKGRQHKSKDVEQQHLLQEDSDEDSSLDRSIESQSTSKNNNNENFQNKNEKSKKVKIGGGLLFKKKYSFEKV